MKPIQSKLHEEGSDSASGVTGGQEQVRSEVSVVGGAVVGGTEGSVGDGVQPEVWRDTPAKFTPKGSSITFWGSGRKDGSDVNNAMGLEQAYRMILGC